jgi:hypothetical protein
MEGVIVMLWITKGKTEYMGQKAKGAAALTLGRTV